MTLRRRMCCALWVTCLLLAVPRSATADLARRAWTRFPLLDAIEIIVRDREVLAVDGRGAGAPIRVRLDTDERALYVDTRGEVGIVVTNKRVLAAAADSPRWMSTYIGVHESLPLAIVLGDEVALVLTDHRAIGLAANCRKKFFAQDIGPNEYVQDFLVGESVAVVVTDKRLLGMSAFLPGFFEQQVGIHERIQRVSALADFVTVATHRRLLVFQAPTATWQEQRLSLR